MIKALLILVFLNTEGAVLMAVEPFATLAGCEAEQARLAPQAKANFQPGQLYSLWCMPVEAAGVAL